LKPLEAMAAGRPVAASDVGVHKELIKDGKTGFLFPAGGAEALADSVFNILENQDSWPEIVENGRQFVETRRWDKVSQAYGPLFERLTRRQASPSADPGLSATR
jgi:glycosyltransferase involved in cell wall biosynthesis